MGSCVTHPSEYPTFRVTNINDEHMLVHKGIMVVTNTDLIYEDSKTKKKWEWPLKYLRRYGCEGNVFSFEAGRKCVNGEGLYAFTCNKANELFEIVARNIADNTETDLLPPLNEPPEPEPVLDPGFQMITSPPPIAPAPPPTSSANKRDYLDLMFDKSDTSLPPPVQKGDVSYSKISFSMTNEMIMNKQKVEKNEIRISGMRNHRRNTEGSVSSSGKKRKHSRESRSPSCSSTSSIDQVPMNKSRTVSEIIPEATSTSSLTNGFNQVSYQNLVIGDQNQTPKPDLPSYSNISIEPAASSQTPLAQQPDYSNITIGHSTTPDLIEQPNYENLMPGQGILTSTPTVIKDQPNYLNYTPGQDVSINEPNYSNITPGPDVVIVEDNPRHLPPDQPNYTNISIGSSSGMTHQRSYTFNHEPHSQMSNRSVTLPHIKQGGNTMQTYIEIDVSGSTDQNSDPNALDKPPAFDRGRVASATDAMHRPSLDNSSQPSSEYIQLNFEVMAALQNIKEERDKDMIQKEKEKEAKQLDKETKESKKKSKK
jgi:hypothetical protein